MFFHWNLKHHIGVVVHRPRAASLKVYCDQNTCYLSVERRNHNRHRWMEFAFPSCHIGHGHGHGHDHFQGSRSWSPSPSSSLSKSWSRSLNIYSCDTKLFDGICSCHSVNGTAAAARGFCTDNDGHGHGHGVFMTSLNLATELLMYYGIHTSRLPLGFRIYHPLFSFLLPH